MDSKELQIASQNIPIGMTFQPVLEQLLDCY